MHLQYPESATESPGGVQSSESQAISIPLDRGSSSFDDEHQLMGSQSTFDPEYRQESTQVEGMPSKKRRLQDLVH